MAVVVETSPTWGLKGGGPDVLQLDGFKAAVEHAGHAVSEFALPQSWDDERERFL